MINVTDVLLLGGTGSIGTQTIDLLKEENTFHIVSISLNKSIDVLEGKLKDLPYLKYVGIANKKAGESFRSKHPEYGVVIGEDCNIKLIELDNYSKVVNALVGEAGFYPSLLVLKRNKDLCLANKESLVIGGFLLKEELKRGNGRLFPIDSEHVALGKLLKNANRDEVKRMIITASGGSLREWPLDQLDQVTLKDVMHHPTWKMGTRITVDSSTMVNKGFEFIEASYLYDWDINNISVLINDESQIHSALEMKDNSYLFEVGPSDMRIPISYALNEGKRVEASYKSVDYNRKCSLNFREFQKERYPLFQLVLDTYKLGGTSMAFLNAVDEETIKLFAAGKINYPQMIKIIKDTVKNKMILIKDPTAENILNVDTQARELIKSLF